MSVGPVNIAASFAGASLAQTKGTEADRLRQEAIRVEAQQRQQAKANDASGIAAADGEDKQIEDRDADGRRQWEFTERQPRAESSTPDDSRQSVDPDGNCGGELDLSG